METKHSKATTVSDTVERYIYQVTRRLPHKSRNDIEKELRGLIEDMLETRCGEIAPAKKDVDIVLMELGSPAQFAEKYESAEGKPQYLIGPALFPQYLLVIKIVLAAVSFGLVVAGVVEALTGAAAESGFALVAEWLSSIFSALFSAAGAVTLVFAIFERRGVSVDGLDGDWLSDLPPVPRKENRFSRGECIVGLVFSALFLLLFVAAPRYVAVVVAVSGEGKLIPLFNMELYQKLLPLIAVSCVLGIAKEAAKLVEGRYTLRLAVGLTIADVISIVLCVIVLSQPIWNESLILFVNEAADLSDAAFLARFADSFGQMFLYVALFGFAVDLISIWAHTLRARREM